MNTKNIFSDFNPVSAKAWKQKIQMDLKGADYNQTLLTNTLEGITIQPFYHKDTYKFLDIPKKSKQAKICQTFFVNDEIIVNKLFKDALNKGAETIKLIANNPFNINALFSNTTSKTEFIISCNFIEPTFIKELIAFSKDKNIQIVLDIINHFAKDGNWHSKQQTDFNLLKELLETPITIGIDASLYQNSGANSVQQIAYALAHVNEYLNEGFTQNNFLFTFAISSNYFFEISKIRAFKYLIKKLTTEYHFNKEITIILEPTLRNKTLYDYNVNLLRTTTESMTAMLSGVDYVSNVAYDAIYHKSNEFGERIARNQLLILNEESFFNNAKDFGKGSYYIEHITYELADKALTLFKDIEKNGGFINQLFKGTVQRKIFESATKEQDLFNQGILILLGTNKYPNEDDLMKNELELYPFVKIKPRKTIIKPIIPTRLAEKLEQERLKLEK